MRRLIVVVPAVVAAVFTVAVPANAVPANAVLANAVPANAGSPWVPAPSSPFDYAAGVTCDFAVHGDPIVDQVVVKTISTYPDGTPEVQLAKGALIFRVTNLANGKTTDADASGSAVFDFYPDGSSVWHVVGPVIAPLRAGTSNLPRGIWTLHGVYDIAFSPANFKTVTLRHGWVHDVCADLA